MTIANSSEYNENYDASAFTHMAPLEMITISRPVNPGCVRWQKDSSRSALFVIVCIGVSDEEKQEWEEKETGTGSAGLMDHIYFDDSRDNLYIISER